VSFKSSLEIAIKKVKTKIQFHSLHRDKKLWLFGEWFGNNCCDNSMYLANYICEFFPEISVVWATKKDTELSHLHPKAKVVYFETDDALKIYKKAGVVFFNQNYKDFSLLGQNYFSGALTVSLWHGAQWKKIGYDASKKRGLLHELRIILDKINDDADIYLALSKPYAKCLMSAYRVKEDRFIYSGYPRNRILYSIKEIKRCKAKLIKLLTEEGYKFANNPYIVLYMPTFRDSVDKVFDISTLGKDETFVLWMKNKNVVIINKSHLAMNSNCRNTRSIGRIFSFNSMIAQELLAASDMLVTDYSSCFFDYLILDRPIIHFLYDYDFYRNRDRGLYYAYDQVVCGDISWNIDDLKKLIVLNHDNEQRNHDLRRKRLKEYMTYETADSCEIITNKIIYLSTK